MHPVIHLISTQRLPNRATFTDHRSGSSIKFILVTQAVARRKRGPHSFARGQQHKFHSLIAAEEEEYDAQIQKEKEAVSRDQPGGQNERDRRTSFEEYREKTKAAGVV